MQILSVPEIKTLAEGIMLRDGDFIPRRQARYPDERPVRATKLDTLASQMQGAETWTAKDGKNFLPDGVRQN
ncbi:MAG: hypothetical protein M3Q76_10935 [Acidobacteriota bacterium]|nr:hypothetical protein [Acidobacteriota bacterium]